MDTIFNRKTLLIRFCLRTGRNSKQLLIQPKSVPQLEHTRLYIKMCYLETYTEKSTILISRNLLNLQTPEPNLQKNHNCLSTLEFSS